METNGNPADNQIDNLAWGTHTENMLDMIGHGRSNKGRTLSAEHRAKVSKAALERECQRRKERSAKSTSWSSPSGNMPTN